MGLVLYSQSRMHTACSVMLLIACRPTVVTPFSSDCTLQSNRWYQHWKQDSSAIVWQKARENLHFQYCNHVTDCMQCANCTRNSEAIYCNYKWVQFTSSSRQWFMTNSWIYISPRSPPPPPPTHSMVIMLPSTWKNYIKPHAHLRSQVN